MLSDLAVTPLAETLRRISAERRSGDLQVTAGSAVKTAYFDRGRLVFAASNMKQDRLGESLVDVGRITESEYAQATALMKMRRQRFGEALVQSGVMQKNEVGRSVARQVRRIVLSLFALPEGAVLFEERECPIPVEYMVNVSLHRLFYEGIRRMNADGAIRRGLGDLSRRVRVAEVPPFRLVADACSPEERELLESLGSRSMSLARLIEKAGGPSPDRLRAAYALVASGVLREDADTKGTPQPVMQPDEEGFLLSSMQRRPERPGRDQQRDEITAELARSEGDRESWLELSRPGTAATLLPALARKIDHYHDLLDAVDDDETLRRNVELILGRAYALKRRIERSLDGEPIAAPPPEMEPEEAGFEPEPEPEPMPAEAPSETGFTAQTSPATDEARDQPEAAPSSEAAMAPTSPPADTPPDARPAAAGAPRGPDKGRIEHLVTWGNIQMTISDYGAAVRTFAELVDEAPEVAAHHVRLAIAMALWPPTAKRAEREFHAALRIEPDNPDAHYQLALYYKSMKLRARALEQLRITLSLDPSHQRAREELEVLSPKDNALSSLKKLFR